MGSCCVSNGIHLACKCFPWWCLVCCVVCIQHTNVPVTHTFCNAHNLSCYSHCVRNTGPCGSESIWRTRQQCSACRLPEWSSRRIWIPHPPQVAHDMLNICKKVRPIFQSKPLPAFQSVPEQCWCFLYPLNTNSRKKKPFAWQREFWRGRCPMSSYLLQWGIKGFGLVPNRASLPCTPLFFHVFSHSGCYSQLICHSVPKSEHVFQTGNVTWQRVCSTLSFLIFPKIRWVGPTN